MTANASHVFAVTMQLRVLQAGEDACLGWSLDGFVLVAALPRAVTERGVLETWDVQSAEEIPVASVLLNTQVRTISTPHRTHCEVSMQFKPLMREANGHSLHFPCHV